MGDSEGMSKSTDGTEEECVEPQKPTKESEEGAVLCPGWTDSANKLGIQIQTEIHYRY